MKLLKIFNYIQAKVKWLYIKYKNYCLKKNMLFCGDHSIVYPPFNIGYRENFSLGAFCRINTNSFINCSGGVSIGKGTIIGPNLIIYSTNHDYDNAECLPFSKTDITSKVTVGENCWIGTNVIILPGVIIGDGCIIGAGTVISRNISSGSVAVGNPAKIVKERNMEHYKELVKKGVYQDFSR